MTVMVLAVISSRDAAGATVKHYFATHGGYFETFPSTVWADGRLRVAGLLQRDLFANGRLRGEAQVNPAAIVLDNKDGGLDYLRDYSFDASEVLVHRIGLSSSELLQSWGVLMSLSAEQPIFDEDTVTFAVRDWRHFLNKPLTNVRYSGSNSGSPLAGIEGTADDLKGLPKPLILGTVFNITPNLVNTTKWIYQVSALAGYNALGGLQLGWTMTVYDMRAALTAGADYTSQAEMESVAPAEGEYRVWRSRGCFRVGSKPAGRITCDVNNPITGGSPDTVYAVVEHLLLYYKSNVLINSPVNDLSSNPEIGIYVNGESTLLQATSQVLAGINGYLIPAVGSSTYRTPTVGQLESPVVAAFSITEDQIMPGTLRQVIPTEDDRGLPVWRVKVNYKRNYTVMGDADLSGSVSDADAVFCKSEWRTVQAEDASVKTQWPGAGELTVNSLLIHEADAQAEADRQLAMFSQRRDLFSMTVALSPASVTPGSVAEIVYPRFGWDSGKTFVVVGVKGDVDASTAELTVWG